MRAVLIHGMGRTALSMGVMANRLARHGVPSRTFSYWPAVQSVEHMVARLAATLAAEADDAYVVIGHSFGGLLARSALASVASAAPMPRRLIQLGTPNASPRWARRLRRHWLYRIVNGEAGQLLASVDRMAAIPTPSLPITVIAGTAGPTGAHATFGDIPNDAVVGVDEVALDGADVVTVRAYHTLLPWDREVFERVLALMDVPRPASMDR